MYVNQRAARAGTGKKEWETDPRYPTRNQYVMESSSEEIFLNGRRARRGVGENDADYKNRIGRRRKKCDGL
jgi:hypothetical protein